MGALCQMRPVECATSSPSSSSSSSSSTPTAFSASLFSLLPCARSRASFPVTLNHRLLFFVIVFFSCGFHDHFHDAHDDDDDSDDAYLIIYWQQRRFRDGHPLPCPLPP